MKNPLVSVIIPVYNTEKFVQEASESIVNQTYSNMEIILVDDCSTDCSYEILREAEKKDARIKILRNDKNLGIAKTRNVGLEMASGEYYAPMDADDVAEPTRIAEEVKFLVENPNCVVVGSQIKIINENSEIMGYRRYPLNHKQIMSVLPRRSVFAQSSTLIRMEAIKTVGFYGEEFTGSEDYELWCKLSGLGNLCNLEKPLLRYRISSNQNKFGKLRKTLKDTVAIQNRYMRNRIITSPQNFIYHVCLYLLLLLPKQVTLKLFMATQLKNTGSKP